MLTVISWYAARRARSTLQEMVAKAMTDGPTLLAIVSDQYTNADHLRPFAPLSERFAARLHVIVAAEWEQPARERDGEVLLEALGVEPQARRRLLRDEGRARLALVLRQRQPVALVEVFFEERGYTGLDGNPDSGQAELKQREEALAAKLQELLVKLPPPAPPPSKKLSAGEHDFSPQGLCRLCGQGASTLSICAGTKVDDGPRRDRFELIELD